ncbi:hypothetical protein PQX77_011345 [Marasmius sp. AFHP31]|nr:hypothetical protein PQX77_011345 [Marasmius sp. AFHP31]
MDKQRAIREVIVHHDLALQRVKEEILAFEAALHEQAREISVTPLDSRSKTRVIRAKLLPKIREQAELERLLSMHRSVSSPALLLPIELWAHILWLCMPETRYPTWNTQFTPVVFGRVCSYWRTMVRSMPELWSSISLYIFPGIGNQRPRWMPLVPALLNRSCEYPLSLEIVWYASKREENNAFDGYFLDLIIPSSSRWKGVNITVPNMHLHRFLEAPLPQLETLSIGGEASDKPSIPHAPCLREIAFASIYLRPRSWEIPWDQLTELVSRSCMRVDVVKAVLARCPRLVRCQLRIVPTHPALLGDVEDNSPLPTIVVLPKLRKFTIVLGFNEDVSDVLDKFEFPALEEMEFSSVQSVPLIASLRTNFWPKAHILSLVSRSGCKLRKLTFRNVLKTLTDMEARDITTKVESLQQLELWCDGELEPLNGSVKLILDDRMRGL